MVSKHYKKQRNKREEFIEEHLGKGHIIDDFIVDRNHPNGAEVHSLLDNGVIIIHNLKSGILISKIIARPQQIRRYYQNTNRELPPEYERLIELARLHERLGYNYI